jgi:hypothetical protein
MVCALITRPLRRPTSRRFEIGRTLFVGPDAVRVFFEGKETKTGKRIDFIYPHFLPPAFLFLFGEGAPHSPRVREWFR